MTIFLDACAIIYLLEAKEPFYSQVQHALLNIVKEHADASISVSRLSVIECLVHPLRQQNKYMIEQYRSFFSRRDLQIIELAPEIIEKALWLRVNYNIRTPDALQAACALEFPHAELIFLTGDKAFKRISELNVKIL